jgi:hypothetical protein
MFTRVLTDHERGKIRSFLDADGERGSLIRSLVSRSRKHLPQIENDVALLYRLLESYEKSKVARYAIRLKRPPRAPSRRRRGDRYSLP